MRVTAFHVHAGHRYKIIPVNPQLQRRSGEKARPSLLEIPLEVAKTIDLVDVFRRRVRG